MSDRIAELARRLQGFLRDTLGVHATIETRTEPATGPRIVVASDIWGDLYAGCATNGDRIRGSNPMRS